MDVSPTNSSTQTSTQKQTPGVLAYDVDVAHSTAAFSIRHMMIATVRGQIAVKSGTVVYDPANPENSQVEAVLDIASVTTNMGQRDDHLRSADFFDVANHPELTFRSTQVEVEGDEATVSGDLTIRGVTKPVTLKVEKEGEITDPWGNKRIGIVATGTINRGDFGLTWNQAVEAGGVLVGDKVKIEIHAQLVERK